MHGSAVAVRLEGATPRPARKVALGVAPSDLRCWRPRTDAVRGVVCTVSHGSFPCGPHLHRAHQLGIVEAGSGIVTSDGARWVVEAGDVVYHAPTDLHAVLGDRAWRYRTFAFDETFLGRAGLGWTPPATTTVLRHRGVATRLASVHRAVEHLPATESTARALLEPLHDAAWRGSACVAPHRRAPLEVERGVRALREQFARRLALDELARLAGLSKYHLVRSFKRTVGVAPHEYQMRLRLAHALISHARWGSGARAAYDAGFADQSHYVRVCLRFLGLAPTRVLSLEYTLPATPGTASLIPQADVAVITRLWQP